MSTSSTQPVANHESPSDDELAHLKRRVERWELKHHILHKTMMSPTVAAAILALVGTLLTVGLGAWNSYIQRDLEITKQETDLIIETLKAEPPKTVSQLDALVRAELLPHAGEKLQKAVRAN